MADIKIRHAMSEAQLKELGVFDWPIWSKEKSCFPWTYAADESCYILEGEVTVTPARGNPVHIVPGDYLTFPKGLQCTWDIHQTIKKHYRFA